jgi:phosphoribosyl-ATP pyrophosphohydrolase
MSTYSKLADKRYRQYQWQKQKESLIQEVATLVFHILDALLRTLRDAGITKKRIVQKVSVD